MTETNAGALMEHCFNDARSIAESVDFGTPKTSEEEMTKAKAQYVKDVAMHIYQVEVAEQRAEAMSYDLMTFCDLAGLDYTKVVNAMRGLGEEYKGKLFIHLYELKE